MATFSISYKKLFGLFIQKQQECVLENIEKYKDSLSLQEMATQMEKDEGEFGKSILVDTAKFANKTANVEILTAFHLSDFYFPEVNTQICFEIKEEPILQSDYSYDDIVANFESDTPIDCSIVSGTRSFNFQIKRYPQAYLEHTSEAATSFLEKIVDAYGTMKGTILIVILQPNSESPSTMNFKEICKNMLKIKGKISFDEIDFIFNYRNQEMVWHQVHPECGHFKKPFEFLSEKFKKRQEEWKDK